MNYVIIILLLIIIGLLIFSFVNKKDNNQLMLIQEKQSQELLEFQKMLQDYKNSINETIISKMSSSENNIRNIQQDTINVLDNKLEKQYSLNTESLSKQNEFLSKSLTSQSEFLNKLAQYIADSMTKIQNTNEEKLNQISQSMNDKLDKSLNERLDSSFKTIGDQLKSLYESLGEINRLSTGVTDLNKTLSNVKTRGIWGEVQLQSILEETMTSSQYLTNTLIKKDSNDRVEFAIKIPSKADNDEIILLPIDSKFPSDIYNKIITASEVGDADMIISAKKELEQRIKTEARTIRDKYISPPDTTDFAIMFLPTESLYSEVLRIDGLNEWCQTNCKIIISGPTTITALLNSLRVGFSNLALNKKSKDVLKLLQAIKAQYSTLNELIDKTQKKLGEAVSSTELLKSRTLMIQKKMSKIGEIDEKESNDILKITDNEEDDY